MTSTSSTVASTSTRSMTAIVAATVENGIGQNGGLPWRLPGEMKYFARVTTGENLPEGTVNAVIMGRKTWQGIPTKFRPLKNRRNLVVSRAGIEMSGEPMSSVYSSLESAFQSLSTPSAESSTSEPKTHRIFLIGGAQLYNISLSPPQTSEIISTNPQLVDRVLLTRVLSSFECDTFLADFTKPDSEGKEAWRLCSHQELCDWVGWDVPSGEVEEKGVKYRYEMWVRR